MTLRVRFTPTGVILASLIGCVPVSLMPIDTDFTQGSMHTTEPASSSASGTTTSGAPMTPTTTDASGSSGTSESSGSSDGSSTLSTEPTTTGLTGATTEVCQPESYLQCEEGDVHWFDSCDVPGALTDECGPGGPVGAPYCEEGDVFSDYEAIGCEGAACTSEIGPEMLSNCDEAGCSEGACLGCAYTHSVTMHACPEFSPADGLGLGGGRAFSACGTANPQTGLMTLRVRKFDQNFFGDRPYQVRVSNFMDEPCGPDANFFVISSDAPTGVGTDELVFSFPSKWTPEQTEKAYCVTASTIPSDPGYDGNNPLQTSWWWSDKLVLTRACL